MAMYSNHRNISAHFSYTHRQAVYLLEFLVDIGGRKLAPKERCLDQTVKFPEKSVLARRGPMAIFDWDVYHLHQVHDFHYLLSRQFSLEGQSVLRSFIVLEFDLDPLSQVGEHLPL